MQGLKQSVFVSLLALGVISSAQGQTAQTPTVTEEEQVYAGAGFSYEDEAARKVFKDEHDSPIAQAKTMVKKHIQTHVVEFSGSFAELKKFVEGIRRKVGTRLASEPRVVGVLLGTETTPVSKGEAITADVDSVSALGGDDNKTFIGEIYWRTRNS